MFLFALIFMILNLEYIFSMKSVSELLYITSTPFSEHLLKVLNSLAWSSLVNPADL